MLDGFESCLILVSFVTSMESLLTWRASWPEWAPVSQVRFSFLVPWHLLQADGLCSSVHIHLLQCVQLFVIQRFAHFWFSNALQTASEDANSAFCAILCCRQQIDIPIQQGLVACQYKAGKTLHFLCLRFGLTNAVSTSHYSLGLYYSST